MTCLLRWGLVLVPLLAFHAALCLPQSAPTEGGEEKGLLNAAMDGALQQSLWRLGPARLTPSIRLAAGYDSNSLSEPVLPAEDTLLSAAPGIRAVVPMKRRAFLDVFQEVDFEYYRHVGQLRDVNHVTRVGGAVGGRRLLLRLDQELRTEKARPTSELDRPLDQTAHSLHAELGLAVGWRQQLALLYQRARYRIEDSIAIDGVPVKNLLDRDEQEIVLQFSRRLTAKTDALVEGAHQAMDYDEDETERDAEAYRVTAGLLFSPKGGMSGMALLGYKRILPKVKTQADYAGLIGSVDVRSRLGARARIRAVYSRDAEPSVLDNNWYYIESRYGGYIDLFLTRRFFLRPGAILGDNAYPRPVRFTDSRGQQVTQAIEDRFNIYSLSVNYHLTSTLILRFGMNYLLRESNYPAFDKDRFLVNIGFTTEVWPHPPSVRSGAWRRR